MVATNSNNFGISICQTQHSAYHSWDKKVLSCDASRSLIGSIEEAIRSNVGTLFMKMTMQIRCTSWVIVAMLVWLKFYGSMKQWSPPNYKFWEDGVFIFSISNWMNSVLSMSSPSFYWERIMILVLLINTELQYTPSSLPVNSSKLYLLDDRLLSMSTSLWFKTTSYGYESNNRLQTQISLKDRRHDASIGPNRIDDAYFNSHPPQMYLFLLFIVPMVRINAQYLVCVIDHLEIAIQICNYIFFSMCSL